MYDFRDYMAKESGMELLVHVNPEGIEKNINPSTTALPFIQTL